MVNKTEMNPTEKRLREALQRLIDQKPTNRELKQKLKVNKLKIIVSNVEKEAEFTNGTAKRSRYPTLIKDIENAEATRVYGESNVPDEVIRAHPLYIKATTNLEKANAEVKKLKAELGQKDERFERYKELLKSQAVRMHQMNVAMWEHIPDEKKHVEVMIDVQNIGTQSNVLNFKRRFEIDSSND